MSSSSVLSGSPLERNTTTSFVPVSDTDLYQSISEYEDSSSDLQTFSTQPQSDSSFDISIFTFTTASQLSTSTSLPSSSTNSPTISLDDSQSTASHSNGLIPETAYSFASNFNPDLITRSTLVESSSKLPGGTTVSSVSGSRVDFTSDGSFPATTVPKNVPADPNISPTPALIPSTSLISQTSSKGTFLQPTSDISASATTALINPSSTNISSTTSSLFWTTTNTSEIVPSSTLNYLFSSSVIASSMIVSTPATTTRNTVNSTAGLPGPASETESMYIIIPVCLVVLFMLVILVVMCHRWRTQVKKVYAEPPPDLWVNSHTEMAVLPAPSTSTVPGLHIENIEPFSLNDAVCCVLHPFPAQLENQMTLKEGDIIKVLEKEENGWWRGENQAGESGWFPGSYVEAVKYVAKLEEEKKKKSRVSSFLLKKRDWNPQKGPNPDDPDIHDKNHSSEETKIVAKQQGNENEHEKRYYAVFSYTAIRPGEITLIEGEAVIGYERDRNGWMRGKRVATSEEGWFPAVYVEEVQDAASMSSESTLDGPLSYDQLNQNKKHLSNQDWIGLEHIACYSYAGGTQQDLTFEAGDKIIVYETLENGWWLGSKGKQVGWLPGSYLQLVDPSADDENRSDTSSDDKLSNSSEDVIKSDSEITKPKPGRKAPCPPKRKALPNSSRTADRLPTTDIPSKDGKSVNHQISIKRYQPIRFQRLSSDPMKPLRSAPAPPGAVSTALNMTNPHSQSLDPKENELKYRKPEAEDSSLPDFKPPSSENFVPVSVSLSFRGESGSHEKLQIKKADVPRLSKPKLHVRRKSSQLSRLAVQSRPSRPVPPRPPPRVFTSNSVKYDKTKSSRDASSPSNPSLPKTGSFINRVALNSDKPANTRSSLPPDIVLSSSNESQLTRTSPSETLPLPPPPLPEELESLSQSPSPEGSTNVPKGPSFRSRKVIKVPPPVIPQTEILNINKQSVDSSGSLDRVKATSSKEDKNLKNENVSQQNSPVKESKENLHVRETESSISSGHIFSGDSNSTDISSVSHKEDFNVGSVENLENQADESGVINKHKFKVPTIKPPPPKSPPPKVQRMVKNVENTDKNKKTLWQAKRKYVATTKGELSFEEGSFIKELRKTIDKPGWYVGMLADGTTGLYHKSYVEESAVKEVSHI